VRSFDLYQSREHGGHVEAVKRGFSWPALFFDWAWAISKGMLGLGAALLAADFAFAWSDAALTGPSWLVEWLGLVFGAKALAVGALANGWRRRRLVAQGYRAVDSIEAHSVRGAIDTWLSTSTCRS
jgi:hypothetical protein